MKDSHGRSISYLRVSVTDRCNLRCRYCMPEKGVPSVAHHEVLRFDEIARVVRVMAALGVNRVRFTGGEPLVRKGIARLAEEIKQTEGIEFVGLTTNGTLLAPMAGQLRDAGVDGINISLDTLDAGRYRELTRCGRLQDALEGLQAALDTGFAVKVNCVLAPQSTREDWLGVVALARQAPVDVRLIEWMPMAGEQGQSGPTADAALGEIEALYGPLQPQKTPQGAGPARYWRCAGFAGRIGVIPAISHQFCASCNRLRLTSTGDLKLCLFYGAGLPLKPLLRGGASDADLAAAIGEAVLQKPKQHAGRPLPQEPGGVCARIDHAGGMYKTGG